MPNIFKNFFLTSTVHPPPLTDSHDLALVLLSYLVASFASFAMLEIANRFIIQKSGKKILDTWFIVGALSMGSGIWAMHFIGMMALRLPVVMAYDRLITMLSWLIAVFFSGLAFSLLKKKGTEFQNICSSGALLGTGIISMHYSGMAAMQMGDSLRYKPAVFFLSIFIGMAVSITALWIIAEFSRKIDRQYLALKTCCALAMGLAVCGVHYTGMAAAVFFPLSAQSVSHAAMDQHFNPQSMA
jgi:NO-binding membrane sensor protein with MHYT domain